MRERNEQPGPFPTDEVDETSDESFPASDPPGRDTLHAGPPQRPREPAESRPAAPAVKPLHPCIRDTFEPDV